MKKYFTLFLAFLLLSCQQTNDLVYKRLEGAALGTTFHITYEDELDQITEKQVDSLIHAINKSLSTYISTSDISKINHGDSTVIIDDMFQEVFTKSQKIYKETEGFFDPTIGALVNTWGFGPEKDSVKLDSSHVKELLQFVGFDKLSIENGRLIKQYKQTYIDFNAIAKGYSVDVIGRFLERKCVTNYMVEIGGEIRARGVNEKFNPWSIAIEKPNFDGSRSFQSIISLENESIATSGNYRKFKIDEETGLKYAHTIDTKTGFPSKSDLLSASVIGKLDCADVDAYATAFMAMGFEKTKEFLANNPNLKAFLIYSDAEGEIKNYHTSNLKVEE
jgi:thiamine biosynthesis lipoprotein